MPADVVRNQYDERWAANYESWHHGRKRWIAEYAAVELMLHGTTGTLLDIPVGTGRFAAIYDALPLAGVLGMDTSRAMMVEAERQGIQCLDGDALDIPMSDKTVDVSVCVRLLNHFTEAEMQTAVRELQRVTRDRVILSIQLGEPYDTGKNWSVHRPEAFCEAIVEHFAVRRMRQLAEDKGRPYWMVEIS